jgi:transcriptional regulator with XRE-family HTH domain
MQGEEQLGAPTVEPTVFRVGIDRATMRGRWLGARLRAHREAAGMKGAQVAERVARSAATLSRWESGDLRPRPADVHYMLELYGVRGEERDLLVRHAEQSKRSGVQEVGESIAVADHAWLEGRAWRIETFHNAVVPGLLQTAEYTREILAAGDPADAADLNELAITTRAARQRRLTDDAPLELAAILDEAVLRRPIGVPEVMRTQLEHVVERSALANVELRVLPFAVGAHAGLTGSFDILRFHDEQDLVYVETCGGDMYIDRPKAYTDAWRRLETVALSEEDSRFMIAAVAKEMS